MPQYNKEWKMTLNSVDTKCFVVGMDPELVVSSSIAITKVSLLPVSFGFFVSCKTGLNLY